MIHVEHGTPIAKSNFRQRCQSLVYVLIVMHTNFSKKVEKVIFTNYWFLNTDCISEITIHKYIMLKTLM